MARTRTASTFPAAPATPAAALLAAAFAAALSLSGCAAGPSGRPEGAPPLRAVASVDLNRYAGLWYEIARYPNSFQRDCEGVTAEYRTNSSGAPITVINTCRTGTRDGKPRRAQARAHVIEGSGGARLAVNFAPVPLPRGEGNYWVIHLDPDYRTALVASPSGRFLWMLSRTPRVTPEQRAALDAAAAAQGFRLDMLKDTVQP